MINKREKGFTIVELIAIICLLSIISLIALTSIGSIRAKIGERQYQSLASTIEVAAKKYASEKGVTKLFVQTLIDEGLISADDESKNIYDPRDNSLTLNCHIVNINDNDAFLEEEDGDCNINVLLDSAVLIKYCPENNPGCTPKIFPSEDSNVWFKESLILHPTLADNIKPEDLNLNESTFRWISPLSPDEVYTDRTYPVNSLRVNDRFELTVTYDNKEYTSYARVRIDKIAPIVSQAILVNPEDWSSKKEISFKIMDADSGLYGYYISKDGKTIPGDTDWITSQVNGFNEKTINVTIDLESDDYQGFKAGDNLYIWVKDIAGNINGNGNDVMPNAMPISNIDTIAGDEVLSLTHEPTLPTYTRVATLKGSAKDSQSGLIAYSYSKVELTKADKDKSGIWQSISKTNDLFTAPLENTMAIANGDYFFCVKDVVGNVNCAKDVVDNIDRVIDYSNVSLSSDTSWNTYATLKLEATDKLSKLSRYCVSTSKSSCNNSWVNLSAEETLDVPSYHVYANALYYLLVEDNAGNSNYTNGANPPSVKVDRVDREGPKLVSGGSVSCGNLSRTYWQDSAGISSLYYYVSSSYYQPDDYYFSSSASLNGNTSIPCYSDPCGTTYYVWLKAVDNLGNISYTRTSSSYSTKACCSEGTWSYSYCNSYGYPIYTRYNQCLGRSETETRTWDGCYTTSSCRNTTTCNYGGFQERTCSYYYAGYQYSSSETVDCQGPTECENTWSYCSGGQQTRWCHYNYGGRLNEWQQTQSCYTPPSGGGGGSSSGDSYVWYTYCNAGGADGIASAGAPLSPGGCMSPATNRIINGTCSRGGRCVGYSNYQYTCTGQVSSSAIFC